jgi:hypothetical protein
VYRTAKAQKVDEIMEVDVAVASIIFLSPGTEASVEYYEPCWAGSTVHFLSSICSERYAKLIILPRLIIVL